MYVSILVKIQPILTEHWAVKAPKVCKNQTEVWHSLTSLWSRCLAARPLPRDRNTQDWNVFSLCPVMPWVYVLEQLEASFMLARHRENPEHVKDKPRSSRPRITTPREDTSWARITRQRQYAASKTIRNLWNLGRPTATRTVRNRHRKANCVHEDQA